MEKQKMDELVYIPARTNFTTFPRPSLSGNFGTDMGNCLHEFIRIKINGDLLTRMIQTIKALVLTYNSSGHATVKNVKFKVTCTNSSMHLNNGDIIEHMTEDAFNMEINSAENLIGNSVIQLHDRDVFFLAYGDNR